MPHPPRPPGSQTRKGPRGSGARGHVAWGHAGRQPGSRLTSPAHQSYPSHMPSAHANPRATAPMDGLEYQVTWETLMVNRIVSTPAKYVLTQEDMWPR